MQKKFYYKYNINYFLGNYKRMLENLRIEALRLKLIHLKKKEMLKV